MLLTRTFPASPVFTIIQIPARNKLGPNRISSLQPKWPICSYPNTPCSWVYSLIHTETVSCPFSPCQKFTSSWRFHLNFMLRETMTDPPSWKQSLDSEFTPHLQSMAHVWCLSYTFHGNRLSCLHKVCQMLKTETRSSGSMHSILCNPSPHGTFTSALHDRCSMGVHCWWWYD